MTRKSALALLVAANLASAWPAAAQQVVEPGTQPAKGLAGARVEERQDGFQLVTHGIWQKPAPAVEFVQQAPLQARNIGGAIGQSRPAIGAASNFRRTAYLPHVHAAEAQYRLPPGLLDALVWTESRYNPLAVSGAGAAGLGQLMPATARHVGVIDRFNPQANILGAARYLRQMLDKFGMVHLALAAYNAGPGAVERAGGIPLNRETPGYVRSVLEFWGAR